MPPPLADANGAKARRRRGHPRVGPPACLIRLATTLLANRYTSANVVLDDNDRRHYLHLLGHLPAIRQHLKQERAFGSKRFQAMAEKTLG